MGRRRRDGRRRAAKVAARRRRREAMARPPRAGHGRAGTAPLTSRRPRAGGVVDDTRIAALAREIAADPDDDDLRDDLGDDDLWDEDLGDDDLGDDTDDDLEDDDEPDLLDLFQDRIRLVVADTVRRRDPETARAFVVETPHHGARPFRGDRTLIDLFVGSWLAKARRRRADPDLDRRAVTWVGENLGETAPVVADAARLLGPAAAEASRENFLRTPPDVVVARIWLLAAVVALAPTRDPVRTDLLSVADEIH